MIGFKIGFFNYTKKSNYLPVFPEKVIVYPNIMSGYFYNRIPNRPLVELYDVDRKVN